MSSLWKRWQTTVNKKYMRPSPKIRKKIRKVLNPCKNILPVVFSYVTDYIKRISLPTLRHYCVEGSMTIEAALVLPLFCLFLMTMGSAMEMIRLHNNLEVALWDAGRKISIYGSLSADREDSENRPEAVAIAYTLIKAQIEEQLGREYLEDAPVDGGSDGLQFLESTMDGDIYEINMTYRVCPSFSFPGWRGFRMANRYYGHRWSGYRIPGTEEERDYVYITENSEVYHTNEECTHIRLTVEPMEGSRIPQEYRPCEKCMGVAEGISGISGNRIYFVPESGDCYHSYRDCPGIKRTVHKIPAEDAINYEECSRCREYKGKTGKK